MKGAAISAGHPTLGQEHMSFANRARWLSVWMSASTPPFLGLLSAFLEWIGQTI